MALIRFQLDLAIPEAVYNTIPADKKLVARDAIRALKTLAVKINAGAANEEDTTRAVWHRCNHDTNGTCEPERDI